MGIRSIKVALCLSLLIASSPTTVDPVSTITMRGEPLLLPANPAVQALVDAVSTDSLRATMERMLTDNLTGFFTRHSNSDTTSATMGIGAARNWAFGRFQSFAAGALGTMTPAFFDFDTTICNITKRHRNVMTTLEGSLEPSRFFIVSAHLDSRTDTSCDSTSFAPGADDDGSGVALVIEMARVMRASLVDASLRFMLVTGEEQGLNGSTAYAKHALSLGLDIDGMVTNDIVGSIEGCANPACPVGEPIVVDSTSVRHFSRDPDTSDSRQLTRAMKLAGLRYFAGFDVTLIPAEDRPGRGGDHIPFGERGYPAARFTEPNENGDGSGTNGHQHNASDLINFIDFNYLTRVTKLNVAGFANLALAPETPIDVGAFRFHPDSVRVQWSSVGAADLAGYRIAFRGTDPDSLFYFDVRDVGLPTGSSPSVVLVDTPTAAPFWVSVSAYDDDFNESRFSAERFVDVVVSVSGSDAPEASRLTLLTANPIRSRATFDTGAIDVSIDLFDAAGRLVRTVRSRHGSSIAVWHADDRDGRPVGPGVYFARTRSAPRADAVKIILID